MTPLLAKMLEMRVRVRCASGHEVELERGFSLQAMGGCTGHDSGEYCYCPDSEIELEFTCPQCPRFSPAQIAKVPE